MINLIDLQSGKKYEFDTLHSLVASLFLHVNAASAIDNDGMTIVDDWLVPCNLQAFKAIVDALNEELARDEEKAQDGYFAEGQPEAEEIAGQQWDALENSGLF